MKKILIALAVVAAVAAAAIFFASSNEVKREFFAMNTFVSAKVKGFAAKDAAGGISTLVRELDSKQLSRYTSGSEISRINSEAETVLSDEVRDYITELLEVGKMSGGKFDIALGAVSDLWSFNDSPRVPSTDELSEALSRSGSDKLSLSGNTLTRADGCIIDLGSAGKGIALDKVKSYLSDKKISSAVVSVGGSVLLYGKGSFNVGVRDPWGEAGRSVMTVKLGAGCVSTSGSYERCFEQGGKHYHHILDPDTGLPVEIQDNVITGRGAGDSFKFAIGIVSMLKGKDAADKVSKELLLIMG